MSVELTQSILQVLGAPVTLYPVGAADLPAYLGAGLVGSTITALVQIQALETDNGEVAVDSERVTLTTDETSAAGITRNRTSIIYNGITYDVYRVLPDGAGAVRCFLRRYL